MTEVVWTDDALSDVELHVAYIDQFNPGAANRLAMTLLETGNSLAIFPHRGRSGMEPRGGSVRSDSLAAEVIHRRGPWKSFEAIEYATLEWADWFNNRRLLEPIGNIPPVEAEQRYHQIVVAQKMAA